MESGVSVRSTYPQRRHSLHPARRSTLPKVRRRRGHCGASSPSRRTPSASMVLSKPSRTTVAVVHGRSSRDDTCIQSSSSAQPSSRTTTHIPATPNHMSPVIRPPRYRSIVEAIAVGLTIKPAPIATQDGCRSSANVKPSSSRPRTTLTTNRDIEKIVANARANPTLIPPLVPGVVQLHRSLRYQHQTARSRLCQQSRTSTMIKGHGDDQLRYLS